MSSRNIVYKTRGNETFTGYLSEPEGNKKAPGILLITAIFGIDEEMKELADAWAADGFVVSVPDMFWRVMPGPTDDTEKAFARYKDFDVAQGFMDVEDLIWDLRSYQRCNGNIGVLGFCFGGRYAQVSAARFGANAVGAYHGTLIEKHLDEVSRVSCPVSFHFGADDPFVPVEVVEKIQTAYASHDLAEVVMHAGVGHNFSMPYKQGFHAGIAAKSRKSVLKAFNTLK